MLVSCPKLSSKVLSGDNVTVAKVNNEYNDVVTPPALPHSSHF